MTASADIASAISGLAQLGAVAQVVRGIRAARKHLDTPVHHGIDGGNAFSTFEYSPRESPASSSDRFLLEAMENQGWAVLLLVIGILAGTVATFLG